MSKRYWKALSGILLALGMVSLVLLITHAAGEAASEWSTDTFLDFCDGTMMNGVDVWSEPGTARLGRNWYPNVRVNDVLAEGKVSPRLSFVLTNTVGTTETHFLVVWEDEHVEDNNPDIYFDRSIDGGKSWLSDTLVSGFHQHSRSKNTPDIAVRLADKSFWVVWQDDRNDDGDIY